MLQNPCTRYLRPPRTCTPEIQIVYILRRTLIKTLMELNNPVVVERVILRLETLFQNVYDRSKLPPPVSCHYYISPLSFSITGVTT